MYVYYLLFHFTSCILLVVSLFNVSMHVHKLNH